MKKWGKDERAIDRVIWKSYLYNKKRKHTQQQQQQQQKQEKKQQRTTQKYVKKTYKKA